MAEKVRTVEFQLPDDWVDTYLAGIAAEDELREYQDPQASLNNDILNKD